MPEKNEKEEHSQLILWGKNNLETETRKPFILLDTPARAAVFWEMQTLEFAD